MEEKSRLNQNSNRGASWGAAIIAGLIGGLAATGVKTLCEIVSPPRAPGVESPLGKALGIVSVQMTGHDVPEAIKPIAEKAVHWFFGTLAGGVYGAVAEKFPAITAGYGSLFGFSFWVVVHEIALPLMGCSPSPALMTWTEQGNEMVSHVLFGVTLEFVRRNLRRKLA